MVDNCSNDGSVEMIREHFPSVILLENREPAGFSANHNRALRIMNGRYVVLLNDDTEALPGCFDRMHGYMERNPDAGCLGCRILNPDGTLQQSVHRMPSLWVLFCHAFFLNRLLPGLHATGGYNGWPHDAERSVPFVVGACMMFPSRLLLDIGLLDEDYYIYSEDADLCMRVLGAGKKVVFFPGAEIIHHGGASMKKVGDFAFHNFYRSKMIFFRKHRGVHTLPFVALLDFAGAVNRVAVLSILNLFLPQSRKTNEKRLYYFKKVIDWYLRRKYRLPPG